MERLEDIPLKIGDKIVYMGELFFIEPNGRKGCYLYRRLEDVGDVSKRVIFSHFPLSQQKKTQTE